MLVSSRLTGRRLVGLPFSDLCPPLVPGLRPLALLGASSATPQAGHLSYVEIRGPSPLPLEEHGFKRAPCFLRDTSSRWTSRWRSCSPASTLRRAGG